MKTSSMISTESKSSFARTNVVYFILLSLLFNPIQVAPASECPEKELIFISASELSIEKTNPSVYKSHDRKEIIIDINRNLIRLKLDKRNAGLLKDVSLRFQACYFSVFLENDVIASGRVSDSFPQLTADQYAENFVFLADSAKADDKAILNQNEKSKAEMKLVITKGNRND